MTYEEEYQRQDSVKEFIPEEEEAALESAIEASLAEDSSDSDSTEISDAERHAQLKSIAEALIFSTNEPLTEAQFLTVVGRHAKGMLAGLVAELNADYVHTGRSIEILHVAKGYQFFTRPEYAHALKKLFTERSRTRLSRAALESLAVIAFRGPVTRAEIDEIRGVESSGVIRTLLDRRLVQVKGRAEVIGRPMLYETTEEFLRHFGLSSLDDLPKHHELTREWGELQESSKESDADVQEQSGIQADPDNEAGSDIEAASGEIGTHEKDKIDTPDVTGDENGHNNQFTVNRENKPLDSEQ